MPAVDSPDSVRGSASGSPRPYGLFARDRETSKPAWMLHA